MMWIVRLALRRPLSVAVMALLMLVMGVLSFTMMNVDIFPAINLPVVMVVWSYPGLNAVDMERRLVIISERAYSTTVDGIEHIESRVDSRDRRAQGLFPAGHGHRRRHRANRCGLGDDSAPGATGHHRPEYHFLQRGERSGRSAQHLSARRSRNSSCLTTA